jgi:hypothetical protein
MHATQMLAVKGDAPASLAARNRGLQINLEKSAAYLSYCAVKYTPVSIESTDEKKYLSSVHGQKTSSRAK